MQYWLEPPTKEEDQLHTFRSLNTDWVSYWTATCLSQSYGKQATDYSQPTINSHTNYLLRVSLKILIRQVTSLKINFTINKPSFKVVHLGIFSGRTIRTRAHLKAPPALSRRCWLGLDLNFLQSSGAFDSAFWSSPLWQQLSTMKCWSL